MTDQRDLQDRIEIIELCTLNHWYIDHGMWEQLDDVLHDEVSMPTLEEISTDPDFDPQAYVGKYVRTRDEIKQGIRSFTDGMTTQHLVAGHHLDIDGDAATCWAHSINVHIPAGAGADSMLSHGNEYQFDMIRTPAGWRIHGWLSTIRWSVGDDSFHDVTTKQRAWLSSIDATAAATESGRGP